jgi:hypothetical protein
MVRDIDRDDEVAWAQASALVFGIAAQRDEENGRVNRTGLVGGQIP